MLSDFQRKKKPFLTLKKIIFQSPKNCTFPKAITHAFSPKMPSFRLFRFGQNKKQNFPKGLTHAFGQKMPIFWLFRFGQNVVSALFAI